MSSATIKRFSTLMAILFGISLGLLTPYDPMSDWEFWAILIPPALAVGAYEIQSHP